jgi:hypothetical protein
VSFLIRLMARVLLRWPQLLMGLIIGWLRTLIAALNRVWLRYCYRKSLKKTPTSHCQIIPPHIYKRPDPLIYDQYYLMAQGIAVTWDNPDIELRRNGVPVPSSHIEPDSDYEIVARIWNGSNDAPAVGLPVDFSYLDFGIGTIRRPIVRTTVDLPVRGAPGHPAFAAVPWHTPAAPGHYCVVVELLWADDANPRNNLGQENLTVVALNSRHGRIQVPVRNPSRFPRHLRMEADSYFIPPLPLCPPPRPNHEQRLGPDVERQVLIRHDRTLFPIDPPWTVELEPPELDLRPDERQEITVNVAAPDDFRGSRPININALDGDALVGGVTLIVES